jgi:hypothetical protein
MANLLIFDNFNVVLKEPHPNSFAFGRIKTFLLLTGAKGVFPGLEFNPSD